LSSSLCLYFILLFVPTISLVYQTQTGRERVGTRVGPGPGPCWGSTQHMGKPPGLTQSLGMKELGEERG
jgi:hypothetical protein